MTTSTGNSNSSSILFKTEHGDSYLTHEPHSDNEEYVYGEDGNNSRLQFDTTDEYSGDSFNEENPVSGRSTARPQSENEKLEIEETKEMFMGSPNRRNHNVHHIVDDDLDTLVPLKNLSEVEIPVYDEQEIPADQIYNVDYIEEGTMRCFKTRFRNIYVEKSFQRFFNKMRLLNVRISIVFMILTSAMFGIWDAIEYEDIKYNLWYIRLIVSCIGLAFLVLTYLKSFRGLCQTVSLVILLAIMACSIIVTDFMIGKIESYGLMILVMGSYVMLVLDFFLLCITCSLITIIWVLLVITSRYGIINNPYDSKSPFYQSTDDIYPVWADVIINSAPILFVNTMGIISAYYSYRSMRLTFLRMKTQRNLANIAYQSCRSYKNLIQSMLPPTISSRVLDNKMPREENISYKDRIVMVVQLHGMEELFLLAQGFDVSYLNKETRKAYRPTFAGDEWVGKQKESPRPGFSYDDTMKLLNTIIREMDYIVDCYGCEKIIQYQYTYVCVSDLTVDDKHAAELMACASLAIRNFVMNVARKIGYSKLGTSIGMYHGDIVGRYDHSCRSHFEIWGKAVHKTYILSQIGCGLNHIHIHSTICNQLPNEDFLVIKNPESNKKDIDMGMYGTRNQTYFLIKRVSDKKYKPQIYESLEIIQGGEKNNYTHKIEAMCSSKGPQYVDFVCNMIKFVNLDEQFEISKHGRKPPSSVRSSFSGDTVDNNVTPRSDPVMSSMETLGSDIFDDREPRTHDEMISNCVYDRPLYVSHIRPVQKIPASPSRKNWETYHDKYYAKREMQNKQMRFALVNHGLQKIKKLSSVEKRGYVYHGLEDLDSSAEESEEDFILDKQKFSKKKKKGFFSQDQKIRKHVKEKLTEYIYDVSDDEVQEDIGSDTEDTTGMDKDFFLRIVSNPAQMIQMKAYHLIPIVENEQEELEDNEEREAREIERIYGNPNSLSYSSRNKIRTNLSDESTTNKVEADIPISDHKNVFLPLTDFTKQETKSYSTLHKRSSKKKKNMRLGKSRTSASYHPDGYGFIEMAMSGPYYTCDTKAKNSSTGYSSSSSSEESSLSGNEEQEEDKYEKYERQRREQISLYRKAQLFRQKLANRVLRFRPLRDLVTRSNILNTIMTSDVSKEDREYDDDFFDGVVATSTFYWIGIEPHGKDSSCGTPVIRSITLQGREIHDYYNHHRTGILASILTLFSFYFLMGIIDFVTFHTSTDFTKQEIHTEKESPSLEKEFQTGIFISAWSIQYTLPLISMLVTSLLVIKMKRGIVLTSLCCFCILTSSLMPLLVGWCYPNSGLTVFTHHFDLLQICLSIYLFYFIQLQMSAVVILSICITGLYVSSLYILDSVSISGLFFIISIIMVGTVSKCYLTRIIISGYQILKRCRKLYRNTKQYKDQLDLILQQAFPVSWINSMKLEPFQKGRLTKNATVIHLRIYQYESLRQACSRTVGKDRDLFFALFKELDDVIHASKLEKVYSYRGEYVAIGNTDFQSSGAEAYSLSTLKCVSDFQTIIQKYHQLFLQCIPTGPPLNHCAIVADYGNVITGVLGGKKMNYGAWGPCIDTCRATVNLLSTEPRGLSCKKTRCVNSVVVCTERFASAIPHSPFHSLQKYGNLCLFPDVDFSLDFYTIETNYGLEKRECWPEPGGLTFSKTQTHKFPKTFKDSQGISHQYFQEKRELEDEELDDDEYSLASSSSS